MISTKTLDVTILITDSFIDLSKTVLAPFFCSIQFSVDHTDQRIQDQCYQNCINDLRYYHMHQIVQEVESATQKEKQYVADKSIGKIAERDQKDRQLDILFKEDLLEISVCKAKKKKNKCIKA